MPVPGLLRVLHLAFVFISVALLPSVSGKVFTRCEFATKLRDELAATDPEAWAQLGDWLCTVDSSNGIDTSHFSESRDDLRSKSYGVFTINNQWWCLDESSPTGFTNPCKVNCTDLLDEDLSDDIRCALVIKKEQSFAAWDRWTNRCKEKNLDGYRFLDNCSVTPQPSVPVIIREHLNITWTDGESNKYIYCQADGTPAPNVSWEYHKCAFSELRVQTLPGLVSRLIFPTVRPYHAGPWTCVAESFFGRASQTYYVNVKPAKPGPESSADGAITYGLAIGLPLLILAGFAASAFYYFRRILLKLNGLSDAEIREFLQGDPERLKQAGGDGRDSGQARPLHENIHYQPYNKEFDIPKGKLNCDKTRILGEGQYGFVTMAELEGVSVAVKAVKPHTDKMYIKALLTELKIMIYLGKNPNIVGLIGAVTNELDKGQLLIVVEFCELGDLQNYLRKRKQCFVPEPGQSGDGDEDKSTNIEMQEYADTASITTVHLITWCRQIARGMGYLESKNVIHGDLAARNVLLTLSLQAKITDFGLSRQLYDYTNYVKKQQAPLPWRHMAIESLREMSFSTESDVWAYGVTMWEVFSMGDVPYSGRSWSLDFVHELENGMRLLQPKNAPDHIYEIMKSCWSCSKYARPAFQYLVAQLGAFTDGESNSSVDLQS